MFISIQVIFNKHSQNEKDLLSTHNFREYGCIFTIHNLLRTQQYMEGCLPVNLKLKLTLSIVPSLKTLGCLEELFDKEWMEDSSFRVGQCIQI